LSPYHVVILAVVAFALVTVAAWWVMQSIPRAPVQIASERSVPQATASAAATAPATSVASGAEASAAAPAATLTSPAAEPVVVDVAGKVRRPGIVELPAGARVVDALDAAGGARIGVDTRSLNLARLLVDGEQIVVGYDVPTMPGGQVPEAGAGLSGSPPTSTGPAITPVDLNTATAEQLDTIPGIGPVTAQAILAWRTEHGGFTTVQQLLDVSGIGDATLAEMIPYVYV
jgi:competence protein ComEA